MQRARCSYTLKLTALLSLHLDGYLELLGHSSIRVRVQEQRPRLPLLSTNENGKLSSITQLIQECIFLAVWLGWMMKESIGPDAFESTNLFTVSFQSSWALSKWSLRFAYPFAKICLKVFPWHELHV